MGLKGFLENIQIHGTGRRQNFHKDLRKEMADARDFKDVFARERAIQNTIIKSLRATKNIFYIKFDIADNNGTKWLQSFPLSNNIEY